MRLLVQEPSLRARLALIYTGLLAVALMVFGGEVYLILGSELMRSFDAGLRADAEHAAGVLAHEVDDQGVLSAPDALIDLFASTGGRVLVLDGDGRLLADSALPGSPALPITTSDLNQAAEHAKAIRDSTVSGDMLRLTVEPVLLPDGALAGYVAWAASTTPMHDLLETVGVALLGGGVVVAGAALVIGLVLARGALAPVAHVTEIARAISLSGDSAARVDTGARRDEVGELTVAFNEMLAVLEQNHLTLRRFLGDASHQLRTPLTTVRANLDLLGRPDLPEAERREILADARDEAERMARLIGDLLSLARAESGARLRFEPVDLDALLVDSVRRQHQATSHVRMSLGAVEPVRVDGDRDRLSELLGILLDNAARYTPAGGSVIASLVVRDLSAIIRVEDTGIGIDEQDRERLFERLYRGGRAQQLRPSGTGLGLAIAHWIVEAHGGRISLTDHEGGGTVATVELPRRS